MPDTIVPKGTPTRYNLGVVFLPPPFLKKDCLKMRYKGKKRVREEKLMKKGYTLIELLFVISVMALLTALAIPSFVGIPDKAKIKAAKDAMTQIRLAQTLYRQDYGEYYINKDNQSDLSGLSRYMQISESSLSHFREDTFSVLTALTTANGSVDGYTMTARAKDRRSTPITATEAVLLPI